MTAKEVITLDIW